MRAKQAVLTLSACVLALPAWAEEPIPTKVYESRRVDGDAPVTDGRLDDAAWETVEWAGDFIQRQPAEGEPPSQQTRFKVLYDDDALYLAFRLLDDPEQVSRQRARRDSFPGDWIEVNVDSYGDRRTAFSFTLSCSGTQGDELISDDGDRWDSNWDPVWHGATHVDEEGWTAEMRIPLSQLRFSAAEEQVWGIQVTRRIYRFEERSSWQRIPRDVSGWVSRFGELRGLEGLSPSRRIELTPYAVAGVESFAAEPGNPFRDGSASTVDGGLDGKIGLTSNLTVDFTLNPDFGQVEADPSEVNLTAFETFFDEKRPFFIEGNDIFDLRLAPAQTGGSFTGDRLFYSRRIGRAPALDPDVPDGAYVDRPENTTILGAFKLSGKTGGGLSIGVLESLTAEEKAAVDAGGERGRQTVEPLTSYFVGRLRQDFRGGETQVGGMLTAVNRSLGDERLDVLRREAYAGGFDLSHYFHHRDYRLEASFFGSELRGSPEAILDAQTSSARYYQRPDNDYVTLDPTRTSLSGHAGSVRLRRTSNHQLVFQTGLAWRSPGFEINDLGFMRAADGINHFTWVAFQKRSAFSIFDNLNVNGNQWLEWDYGGHFLGSQWNVNSNAQFRNKYSAGFGVTRSGERISNTELRGGPSSRWPGAWSYSFWVESDHRKKIAGSLGGFARQGDEGSDDNLERWASVTWRPSDALRLSLSPSYGRSELEMQYVATTASGAAGSGAAGSGAAGSGAADRYVFGRLEQETTVLTVRLDYSITPDLTVQLYASPFVSTGRYSAFKRVTDPRAGAFRDRFEVFGGEAISYEPGEDRFEVDENGDGTVDYSFGNPDFDFRELNTNLVVRWEYRPGSTVFLVWSQVRDDASLLEDDLGYRGHLNQLFSAPAHDVVLVKVSKWLSL